jgi:DNA polymerase
LSGNGEDKLKIFESGLDVYKTNASATFNVAYDAVDKDQRQVGKVQELACGFGGGIGAFAAMGRVYGLQMPEDEARKMVNAWRRANPWSVQFWNDLEEAYTRALRNKNEIFTAGRISYLFDGQHLWYSLPSGRVLCYPYARFEDDNITYAKASWKPAADAKEWPRARLWRGLACENVTQATAHDLLRSSLRCLDSEGFNVVLHVHDEIVLETDQPEEAKQRLEEIMTTPPEWAQGLPLQVEAGVMGRYGK